ncbi:hypothetical protein AAFF_G00146640 [Aldrovandia affinis]|uniref:Uncharacterized protein n=1 Tax=Aldrovandia affinis TaxID=143900 RepID=A0AAD7W8N0_9TELE|nr:hypothetical protein AAFF_G00146640 [Aldrovandia affinis]
MPPAGCCRVTRREEVSGYRALTDEENEAERASLLKSESACLRPVGTENTVPGSETAGALPQVPSGGLKRSAVLKQAVKVISSKEINKSSLPEAPSAPTLAQPGRKSENLGQKRENAAAKVKLARAAIYDADERGQTLLTRVIDTRFRGISFLGTAPLPS